MEAGWLVIPFDRPVQVAACQLSALPEFPSESSNSRHSGMRRLAQARNPYSLSWLWIPGSLVSLAPRNDVAGVTAAPPRPSSLSRAPLARNDGDQADW